MSNSPFNDAVETLEEVERQLGLLLQQESLQGYALHHVEVLSHHVSQKLESLKPGGGLFASKEKGEENV